MWQNPESLCLPFGITLKKSQFFVLSARMAFVQITFEKSKEEDFYCQKSANIPGDLWIAEHLVVVKPPTSLTNGSSCVALELQWLVQFGLC